MDERLKESQLIGTQLKATNEEYECRITESQKELKMASTSAQDSKIEADTHLHHLRNTLGKFESTKEELSKAKELLVRYQQDRQEMKQLKELVKKAGVTNYNTTNTMNIVILPYNETDVSHLKDKDYYNSISRCIMSVPKLIEKTHFDPNKPENHNTLY